MSKECTQARNIVLSAFVILALLIMLMSSCGSVNKCGKKKLKKCCEKTSQAVYEYEGLVIE